MATSNDTQSAAPVDALVIHPLVKDILRDWMLREMSDISEEHYCAGWLLGLEHVLWRAILQMPNPYVFGTHEIEVERLERLKQVSELIGEWGVWDKNFETETTLPLYEWRVQFDG